MRLFTWMTVVLCSATAFSQQPPAVRLWAVSDGVRVSPVTGNLIENQPFIHKDYPAGDPRDGNLVWNPAARTVSLKAARNEFAAFQLIIETGQPQNDFDVKLELLTHEASGARIDGHNIAIFKEWYS